jgi:hypothetical protein
MKFSISLAAVTAAFLPSAFAHVSMDFPTSFVGGADGVSPLAESGANFPCMAPSYSSLSSQLTIQPGESGNIVLSKNGGAPHGGGSCQISLTYDSAPTAGSRFTVIKSFMGACPVAAQGNEIQGPYTLPYTIPQDAPSGNAILAWTWFNKIGNREMYMRCSPITIGGSNTVSDSFSSRPEIFKANIGNACETLAGTDVIFPNPGPDFVGQGTAAPKANSPGACGSSGTAPIVVPEPSSPVAAPAPTGILAPPNNVVKLPAPITKPIESPAETPVETPVEDDEDVVSNPISPPVVSPPTVAAPEAPVAPPTNDAIPCNNPGAVVCQSDDTFALCNFGFLVPMGRTASGTKCQNGVISKRSYPIRLTGHLRRRHGKF